MHQLCFLTLVSVLVFYLFPSQVPEVLSKNIKNDPTNQLMRLRSAINCTDREHVFERKLHSNYWVLLNYVQGEHDKILCSSSVTFTTHGDYRYLDNVAPLVDRWLAPISLALYAPGTDFDATVHFILWLRQCEPQSELIRKWVSFHIYFPVEHVPQVVLSHRKLLRLKVNCSKISPFSSSKHWKLYRRQKHLKYQVNVGRNIAKAASLTHFVLAADIELYPSPGLVKGFLNIISRNLHLLDSKTPIVYPLNIFEVEKNTIMPKNKMELKYQMAIGEAIPFHMHVCPECHKGPGFYEWINYFDVSNEICVFGAYNYSTPWEPTYIGSINDPEYDERLSWEGMSDKRTQAIALCLLNYEFHILDNAFLVHKPGIKRGHKNEKRNRLALETFKIVHKVFYNELILKYGFRQICRLA